ncbi:MAG: M14-type cytosolic carboxypeptidase [Ginsengibacter sp.]
MACSSNRHNAVAKKQGSETLRTNSTFERGAIGATTYTSADTIVVDAKHWKKRDSIGDQYYWFDFILTPVRNKTVTVVLNKLTGIYRGNKHEVYNDITFPVFSYNNRDWQRISQVKYNEEKKSFSFTAKFEQDSVWLAYAHPYSLEKPKLIRRDYEKEKDMRMSSLGFSKEGRKLNLFSISDFSIPDSEKKVAVIISLQHTGEDAGAFLAEGLIRFLMSDNNEARDIKKKWIVHIVPVMNPDGLYNGITRYNAQREDLNSIWLKSVDSLQFGPEVKAARQWLEKQFQSSNPPDIFFDIHSHSQQLPGNDIFSINPKFEAIAKAATALEFPLNFIRNDKFEGSSVAYIDQHYKIPAATIELTQSYVNDKDYLTIEDYEKYGELLMKSLNASF